MAAEADPEGRRVLVVAPFGRDADSITGPLTAQGYEARAFPDLAAVAAAIDDDAGVVLLTEEALRQYAAALKAALARQPDWSDVLFLVLASRPRAKAAEAATRAAVEAIAANAVVLERPLGLSTLVSATAAALRSRRRQFELRDRIAALTAARAELIDSESRLRLATDAADIGFWDHDLVAETVFWPPIVKAMFGLAADTVVTRRHLYDGLHPDDAPATIAAFEAAADPYSRALYDVEYRTVSPRDGSVRWVAAKGRGLFDADGRCIRMVGTVIDISRRKVNEIELRVLNESLERRVAERTAALEAEMASRADAEEALRQSQKMEAVGQLTGGIAHDFNNMLTGIIGAMDLMQRRIAAGRTGELGHYIEVASASAQRAAALTSRLLAFSRRQTLDPQPVDTGALIAGFDELLRRSVGENVALAIVAGADVPAAIVDANQLENAILNLAINARDAMPGGGRLTIETRAVALADAAPGHDLPAGRYVVVSVTDTGIGMSAEVLEKVFDPFFTTKAAGEGTGLGLSMVYGFAKQSAGQVRVHSTPGMGTTVSLYLPAAAGAAVPAAPRAVAAVPTGAGQTVLLVEDDPAVRLLVREVLGELDYTALVAEQADQAVALLTAEARIDLMISDVGLPGLNGRQLAEIARLHRPRLPILFITGYAENAAVRAGFLGERMDMIAKPFAIDTLAAKIAEMIGGY